MRRRPRGRVNADEQASEIVRGFCHALADGLERVVKESETSPRTWAKDVVDYARKQNGTAHVEALRDELGRAA